MIIYHEPRPTASLSLSSKNFVPYRFSSRFCTTLFGTCPFHCLTVTPTHVPRFSPSTAHNIIPAKVCNLPKAPPFRAASPRADPFHSSGNSATTFTPPPLSPLHTATNSITRSTIHLERSNHSPLTSHRLGFHTPLPCNLFPRQTAHPVATVDGSKDIITSCMHPSYHPTHSNHTTHTRYIRVDISLFFNP